MNEFEYKLYTIDDIQAWPEPEWLIKNILPLGGFTEIYGKWGGGKTFVVLDWALSVASGIKWGGVYPVQQGPVVYVFGEGRPGIKRRINAWLDHHRYDRESKGIPFVCADTPPQLTILRDINKFAEDVTSQLSIPPKLIIFDTLARSIVGVDEDKSKDMGVVVAAADYFRKEFGSTVVVVHHSGYNEKRARGSSAIPGGLDTIIKADKKEDSRVIKITCDKMKDGGEFEDIAVTLVDSVEKEQDGRPVTLVCEMGGRLPVDSLDDLVKGKHAKTLLEYMVTEGSLGSLYGDLRSALHDLCQIPEGSFPRAMKELEESQLVEKIGPLYVPTDKALAAFN